MTHVIVLGAGPAGLAAAVELAEANVKVTLIERLDRVGGNASSFRFAGVNVDYGSHRLHPASDPEVMRRVQDLLGEDLLVRPRHGRIRLMGRWIHFPLRPVDLLLRMHPRFAFGVLRDLLVKMLPGTGMARRGSQNADESFASVLSIGLGKTICEQFYFPYSKKIWGVDPDQLSALQAYKRVSAGSIGKMIKRLLPGGKGGASTKGIFYYPRHGYGQICGALLDKAREAGVSVLLETNVQTIFHEDNQCHVIVEQCGEQMTLKAEQVYTTIPLTLLARLMKPAAPKAVMDDVASLRFRSMVLVYLHLQQQQFTEYDAHYFPGPETAFSRISETKNYSDLNEPADATVLCAEVPCFRDDEIWNLSEDAFAELVKTGLKRVGLPIQGNVAGVTLRRLPFAYPLYLKGYEAAFDRLDHWIGQQPGILSFGRQGLYAHDNTHHAIFMAIEAARCLQPDGRIDAAAWRDARKVFESHVVED